MSLRLLQTLSIGCVATSVLACAPPPRPTLAAPPQVTLIGARLQVYRGDEQVAQGRAAKITYQRNSGDVVASEAHVKLPRARAANQASGVPTAASPGVELRAPEVRGSLTTQQSAASGGVIMRTADGMTGRTPSAAFDGVAQRASGSEPIRLEGQTGWTLDAAAFEFLLPEERFSFFGQIVTRSSPDAPAPAGPTP